MAGYEWRVGVRKMPVAGFNAHCGTEQGIKVHERRGESLCDSCGELWARKSIPRTHERTHCMYGHELEGDRLFALTGRCGTCRAAIMAERVICQTCGKNCTRSAFYDHRTSKKYDCREATFLVAA